MGSGAEHDVATPQAGQLRDAQPSLNSCEQQRVVTAAEERRAVRRGDQRVDLGIGEECDDLTLEAFRGDGEYALDHPSVFGVSERRELEERMDGRQPGVT